MIIWQLFLFFLPTGDIHGNQLLDSFSASPRKSQLHLSFKKNLAIILCYMHNRQPSSRYIVGQLSKKQSLICICPHCCGFCMYVLEEDRVKGQMSICLKEGICAKSLSDLLKMITHAFKQYNPCSKNISKQCEWKSGRKSPTFSIHHLPGLSHCLHETPLSESGEKLWVLCQ